MHFFYYISTTTLRVFGFLNFRYSFEDDITDYNHDTEDIGVILQTISDGSLSIRPPTLVILN